jgi:hypothetical protein
VPHLRKLAPVARTWGHSQSRNSISQSQVSEQGQLEESNLKFCKHWCVAIQDPTLSPPLSLPHSSFDFAQLSTRTAANKHVFPISRSFPPIIARLWPRSLFSPSLRTAPECNTKSHQRRCHTITWSVTKSGGIWSPASSKEVSSRQPDDNH